jgi:hypothetical protein
VPSGLYLVVMEWMDTITGDRVGYPGFGGFFFEEKNFGEPSSASFILVVSQRHLCQLQKGWQLYKIQNNCSMLFETYFWS